MAKFMARFKALINRAALNHAVGALVTITLLAATYLVSSQVPPSLVTWALALPADIIILLTAIARLNDLGTEKHSKRWQVRRMGFIFAGVAALGFILTPFETIPQYASWKGLLLHWGVALTWFTTPNMPPWWKYINGDFRKGAGGDGIRS